MTNDNSWISCSHTINQRSAAAPEYATAAGSTTTDTSSATAAGAARVAGSVQLDRRQQQDQLQQPDQLQTCDPEQQTSVSKPATRRSAATCNQTSAAGRGRKHDRLAAIVVQRLTAINEYKHSAKIAPSCLI